MVNAMYRRGHVPRMYVQYVLHSMDCVNVNMYVWTLTIVTYRRIP